MFDNVADVVIRGIGEGFLFHSPEQYAREGAKKTARKTVLSREEEAAASCYWMDDHSSLAIPAFNIHRGMLEACIGSKLPGNRKMALGPIVAGDVILRPRMIPFNTKEYLIDSRLVTVNRQRIMRHRAWLPNWQLSFEVCWESQYLGREFDTTILAEILERLGKSIGIGDFRPRKSLGPFGRFEVVGITPPPC